MITSDPSVIAKAVDLGINYFDTARSYQHGNNERMVLFFADLDSNFDTNGNGSFEPGIDYTNSPATFGRRPGDIPLAIDWDGDGRQELAIFRPGGTWFIDLNHDGCLHPRG
jgi:hypothetical protein